MLAGGRVFPWREPQPGREMPPRCKVTRIHRQGHRDRGDRSDARDRREQSTDRIDLMLVEKPPIQFRDFGVEVSNMLAHLSEHRPCRDRNCLVRG